MPLKKEESPDPDCLLTSVARAHPDSNDSKEVISLDSDDDDILKYEDDEDEKIKVEENEGMTADQFFEEIAVNTDPKEGDDHDCDLDEEGDKNDDDFVDESSDDNDSDDSDDSEAQAKRKKSKKGAHSLSSIAKDLKTMENLRRDLIVKKYEGKPLTPSEHQKIKALQVQIAETKQFLEENSKDPPPKNAREYWQRQLKSGRGMKRKRDGDEEESDPKKTQKTDQSGFSKAAALFNLSLNQPGDANNTGPELNQIKATTHASQMQQIMAGMPEGCDTRHTKTQKHDLIEAKQCFGYGKVKAINGDWLLKGMKTPLRNEQLVGAEWMVMREAMDLHPAGGILADDMGIGKTLIALTTIFGHPPEAEDRREWCNATLVIADSPQAAETTWMKQINQHVGGKLAAKSLIYSKAIVKDLAWWRRRTVVVTNLTELRSQFLSKRERQALSGKWAGDPAGYRRALLRKLGPFFKINWYRVIIDEAHGIKNHTTSAALAAFQLNAKYRWALSGTPLTNKLDELFPLVKFIGYKFATSMRRFRAQYIRGPNAQENFEHLVGFVMLRRKQTEKFLGRTMVPLPKSYRKDIWVPLSTPEKILNDIVDGSYKAKLPDIPDDATETGEASEPQHSHQENEYASDEESEAEFEMARNVGSTVFNSYRVLNTRLMRLSQLPSHPLNLEKFFRGDGCEEEVQSAIERFKSEVTQSSVHADQKAFAAALNLEKDYSSGLQQLESAIKDKFGGVENMAELLPLAANEKKVKNITCGLCHKQNSPVNPVYSANCEHIYCKSCLHITLSATTKAGRLRVAPMCRAAGCSVKLVMGNDVRTPACIDAAVKAIRGYKESGRDDIGTGWRDRSNDPISFFRAVSGRDDIGFGPVAMPLSSKLKATLAVALTWMKEAPDDKMIIYIRWTRTAKVLGCVLESMGIKFLYMNRMANRNQKSLAMETFSNSPEVKILVASMKCGGQSFNFQMANRCIIVDEWWNLAVEEQAFRRVLRTGQKKETHLVRILAEDTIDQRIIMLQEAKQETIQTALQDWKNLPDFSGAQQLRWIFSSKDKATLASEMVKKIRVQKTK
ncbi:hypothetical protein F53441_5455 [Fusarium austroafricanum]|uniref:Helicase ATP-binding domain-containing protein n=1 Tax=Fusarium austroafricanum TaxID=2364996 RepID=A0A8H4KLP9_9HYPO|nr:hypothetical protein F53441_5455 [Fusarium austroafricanum]